MGEGNGNQSNVPTSGKDSGESVATYWARVLSAAKISPVVVADKRGEDVAVVVGVNTWAEIEASLIELDQRRAGTYEP